MPLLSAHLLLVPPSASVSFFHPSLLRQGPPPRVEADVVELCIVPASADTGSRPRAVKGKPSGEAEAGMGLTAPPVSFWEVLLCALSLVSANAALMGIFCPWAPLLSKPQLCSFAPQTVLEPCLRYRRSALRPPAGTFSPLSSAVAKGLMH